MALDASSDRGSRSDDLGTRFPVDTDLVCITVSMPSLVALSGSHDEVDNADHRSIAERCPDHDMIVVATTG